MCLVEERFEVKPSRIGKWSTTLQLLTLAVALSLLHDPKLFSAPGPRCIRGPHRFYNRDVGLSSISIVGWFGCRIGRRQCPRLVDMASKNW